MVSLGPSPAASTASYPCPQLVEEGGEDLVEHRFLGVEVVVEAAGEHPRLVRDLADGGGVVALRGEHLGGGVEEFAAPLGRRAHLGLLLAVGTFGIARVHSRRYACWLLTETVSPVMYDE